MALGGNQIAAYAADLLDLEDQIEALQTGKRDLYASIRDEHGKSDANALKRAVKLSRMDDEKRDEAEAVDTEAQRMLKIIEASRAPRATHVATTMPVPEIPSIGSVSPEPPSLTEADADANTGGSHEAVTPLQLNSELLIENDGMRRADASDVALGSDVEPVALHPAALNALKLRPYCLHADDLTQCAGVGKKHCAMCLAAHADAEGMSA